MMNTTVA